jgi:hypothetical protein
MSFRRLVLFLLLAHVAVLMWVAATLPVGPHEAQLYYTGDNVVSAMMHWGRTLFPDAGFLGFRAPFLMLHMVNLYLFYHLSATVLKDEKAILTSFLVFLLLPGIVSSAILATSTGLILAVYQLFLILALNKKEWAAYAVLPLFLFIDKSCVIFYFALMTYALWHRKIPLLGISATLFAVAVSLYGIQIHGKPVNYFVDTVALYAAIFSPLLFLYFFYAMYRILFKGEKGIIWHISFTVLILSFVISMRQRIPIEDFAPYVIVAIPLMVGLFFRSYRVRLPRFRKGYRAAAALVFAVLVLNTAILLFHRPLFLVVDKPARMFAAPFYLPYWCAEALKKRGIHRIDAGDGKLSFQLRFYGIEPGGAWKLSKKPCRDCQSVTIRYRNRPVWTCYVSKINN